MRRYAVAADISLFFTSALSILRWNIPIKCGDVFACRWLITVAPNTASSFPHFSGSPNTAIGDASVAVAIRPMMVRMDAMLIDQNPASPSHTTPGHAPPCLPCLALPRLAAPSLAKPSHACLALPGPAQPGPAHPRLPCLASPCRA